MAVLSSPKTLYFTRLAQLLFAIGFLIIVSWCGTHRAWWHNINAPLAVGIIATVLTLGLALYTLIRSHLKRNPFADSPLWKTIAFLCLEGLLFALWVVTIVLMLRGKSGCDEKLGQHGTKKDHDLDVCLPDWDGTANDGKGNGEDKRVYPRGDQPLWQWNIGVAFAVVEAVVFLVTAVLVFMERKGTKGAGGASYA